MINNISPTYIQQLVTPYLPARTLSTLGSRNKCLLTVPKAGCNDLEEDDLWNTSLNHVNQLLMWQNRPDNIRKSPYLSHLKSPFEGDYQMDQRMVTPNFRDLQDFI